ncbi:MAG: hypothetical protein J7484_02765 [Microbacterium sp.]|nr:hypothetical protein [Microbacterium sp.]
MKTEVRRELALSVASALARSDRSVTWLAATSGIPEPRLRRALAAERDFTLTDLGDVAAALGIRVVDLLPASPS